MFSLTILSINSEKDLVRTCIPDSLEAWLKDNKIRYNHSKHCFVNINEVKSKRFGCFLAVFSKSETQIEYFINWLSLNLNHFLKEILGQTGWETERGEDFQNVQKGDMSK